MWLRVESNEPTAKFPKRFWMVYSIGEVGNDQGADLRGKSLACLHWSRESAHKEASRLARLHPNTVFVVLESVEAIYTPDDILIHTYD